MKYQPSADRYSKMQYKYCGNSGLLLPRISLGLWHNFGSVDDFGVATDMIKYAFDSGVTHFDLANNYGPVPGSRRQPQSHRLQRAFHCPAAEDGGRAGEPHHRLHGVRLL